MVSLQGVVHQSKIRPLAAHGKRSFDLGNDARVTERWKIGFQAKRHVCGEDLPERLAGDMRQAGMLTPLPSGPRPSAAPAPRIYKFEPELSRSVHHLESATFYQNISMPSTRNMGTPSPTVSL